ncbi:hypothetical protein GCM10011410_17280 [Hoyosella rhizosphaerae]|uniref:Uncharacterized protein n=1 Tax=Hoyosella rhizosphaerae TaxID=1755582 RepID=A0A916UAR7_9ACTN|nr:hypothetical protein GCM10011410_17280 [Hoyosella rhizosphaerae]
MLLLLAGACSAAYWFVEIREEQGGSDSIAPIADSGQFGSAPSAEGLVACDTSPRMAPVGYRAGSGVLTVVMDVTATCATGDILTTNALRVAIESPTADVAAAEFDMSNHPTVLPADEPVRLAFEFPSDSVFLLPGHTGQGDIVTVTDEGTSEALTPGALAEVNGNSSPIRAVRATEPASGDREAAARRALRELADADFERILTEINGQWVPQVSSKQEGLRAKDLDGTVVAWNAQEILRQHMDFRLDNPGARLLWSNEWPVFDLQGWWVTVIGPGLGSADTANQWCDDQNIEPDECFAKLISDTRGSAGTTRHRR